MKKIIVLLGLLVVPSICLAERFIPQTNDCIYISSYTATADTLKYLTNSRFLKSIVVSSTTAGGYLKIYNSTFTSVNQVLPAIDLGTLGVYDVDLVMSEGITYSAVGNTNGVSIIYRKK